jgi:hypothetical protein
MAEHDRTVDRQRGWAQAIAFFSCFGIIPSILFEFVGVALLLILIAPISVITFFILRKMDVPNRIRVSVLPMLIILREDADLNATLHLRADLRGATVADKQVGQEEVLIDTSVRRVAQTRFCDAWLRGSVRLCDGSQLKWEVSDLVKQRRIRKSSVGRTKFKTKYKRKTRIDVTLIARRDRYQVDAPSTGDGPKLKKQDERKSVLRYRRAFASKASPDNAFDFNGFMLTISTVHQCLKPLGARHG